MKFTLVEEKENKNTLDLDEALDLRQEKDVNESLQNDEISLFFKRAKEVGAKTLGDLKRLLQEPEFAGKDEAQGMKDYRDSLGKDFKIEESLDLDKMQGIKLPDYYNTWSATDSLTVSIDGKEPVTYYLMENDVYGDETFHLVVTKDFKTIYETFDDIETCLRDEGILEESLNEDTNKNSLKKEVVRDFLDFLSDHEIAKQDFVKYFNLTLNKFGEVVGIEKVHIVDIMDWIMEHPQLQADFETFIGHDLDEKLIQGKSDATLKKNITTSESVKEEADISESVQGKTCNNDINSLSKLLKRDFGKGTAKHEGNFRFTFKTDKGKTYYVVTSPVDSKDGEDAKKIKIDDVLGPIDDEEYDNIEEAYKDKPMSYEQAKKYLKDKHNIDLTKDLYQDIMALAGVKKLKESYSQSVSFWDWANSVARSEGTLITPVSKEADNLLQDGEDEDYVNESDLPKLKSIVDEFSYYLYDNKREQNVYAIANGQMYFSQDKVLYMNKKDADYFAKNYDLVVNKATVNFNDLMVLDKSEKDSEPDKQEPVDDLSDSEAKELENLANNVIKESKMSENKTLTDLNKEMNDIEDPVIDYENPNVTDSPEQSKVVDINSIEGK